MARRWASEPGGRLRYLPTRQAAREGMSVAGGGLRRWSSARDPRLIRAPSNMFVPVGPKVRHARRWS